VSGRTPPGWSPPATHVVAPQRGVGRHGSDDVAQQLGRAPQALVVAGLAGQVREQVAQVAAGISQPAGLRGEAEQGLHDRQGEQLGVAELGWDPHAWPPWCQVGCLLQQLVYGDVQCGGEGVQVGHHEASTRSALGSNADHGHPPLIPAPLGNRLATASAGAWLVRGHLPAHRRPAVPTRVHQCGGSPIHHAPARRADHRARPPQNLAVGHTTITGLLRPPRASPTHAQHHAIYQRKPSQ
jgi:hypothetical protein